MKRWHRRHELLPRGYRFTVFTWWYVSIGTTVVVLGLFGVKLYEWIYWTRIPMEPQIRFLQIFCPLLFIVLFALMELGWLSGTTESTDRRKRGLRPADRPRRNRTRPPSQSMKRSAELS